VIVDAGGGNVRVAKPFLHFGDVGLMVERVGRSRRLQRMRPDLKSEPRGVGAHKLVNAVGRDRLVEPAGRVVAKGPEQRAGVVGPVAGRIKVVIDEAVDARMQRQIARLAAFARHFEMRDAFANVAEILDLKLAQFLPSQRVKEQGGENGAVALAADIVGLRGLEELASCSNISAIRTYS
jgi:hypothetical protein